MPEELWGNPGFEQNGYSVVVVELVTFLEPGKHMAPESPDYICRWTYRRTTVHLKPFTGFLAEFNKETERALLLLHPLFSR